jgi:hypothetical protein
METCSSLLRQGDERGWSSDPSRKQCEGDNTLEGKEEDQPKFH